MRVRKHCTSNQLYGKWSDGDKDSPDERTFWCKSNIRMALLLFYVHISYVAPNGYSNQSFDNKLNKYVYQMVLLQHYFCRRNWKQVAKNGYFWVWSVRRCVESLTTATLMVESHLCFRSMVHSSLDA